MPDTNYLTGQLLIAMPSMADPNFDHTVTFVCEHSEHGALGLIINRPMEMDLGVIFEQLSLPATDQVMAQQPVLKGGPVQVERGFVLHESDQDWDATVEIDQSIFVTTSQDILSSIAKGEGPARSIIALGYAGWGAGQLEAEMIANAWLTVPASSQIIFDTPFEERWSKAAESLGIDLAALSPEAGHA